MNVCCAALHVPATEGLRRRAPAEADDDVARSALRPRRQLTTRAGLQQTPRTTGGAPAIAVRFFLLYVAAAAQAVEGMASARHVFFSGRGSAAASGPSSVPAPPPLVAFLHGRLEPDVGEAPYARPAELYGDFCRSLAERLPPAAAHDDGTSTSSSSVLLVDYEDILERELKREPRDLRLGPVSSAVAEDVRDAVLGIGGGDDDDASGGEEQETRRIVLVTYSMGAAMGLKLLAHHFDDDDPSLRRKLEIERVILIEPVWRCWLPFAVSSPRIIAEVPALALYGTEDELTKLDSGGSVAGSLRPFLPNLETVPLEGGNHWGIVSEDVAGGDIATEGLISPDVVTPSKLREEMVDRICCFCGWD